MSENVEMSPYAAANQVTEWLRDTEFGGQKIAPQMMYQYVDAGRIPARRDANGHWKIDEENLKKWFEGYVNRKRNLVAKASNAANNLAVQRKSA